MYPYNALMLDFLSSVYKRVDENNKFIWVYKGESIVLTLCYEGNIFATNSKNVFYFCAKNYMHRSEVRFDCNEIFVNDEIVTSLSQLFRCLQTNNSVQITTDYNKWIAPENLFLEQEYYKFYMKYI